MKTLLFSLALWAVGLIGVPVAASAHSASQLPFVKIDGTDAAIYPVGSTSISTLTLPQDLAAAPALVEKPVAFELESANLPILPENIPHTTFSWDFGDGSQATGMAPRHAYAKMGSYFVELHTTDSTSTAAPQLLDIILVNVVPDTSYQLPHAGISVGGRSVANPYTDILKEDFSQELTIDGSSSTAGSSTIASYFWDFGDQQTASHSITSHRYGPLYTYVSILLRITDGNGFIADQLVQVENSSTGLTPTPTPPAPAKLLPAQQWVTVAGIAVLILGGAGYLLLGRKHE